jgi:hypothetical protein
MVTRPDAAVAVSKKPAKKTVMKTAKKTKPAKGKKR